MINNIHSSVVKFKEERLGYFNKNNFFSAYIFPVHF